MRHAPADSRSWTEPARCTVDRFPPKEQSQAHAADSCVGRLREGPLSEERVERRLAAILAADVVGYSPEGNSGSGFETEEARSSTGSQRICPIDILSGYVTSVLLESIPAPRYGPSSTTELVSHI